MRDRTIVVILVLGSICMSVSALGGRSDHLPVSKIPDAFLGSMFVGVCYDDCIEKVVGCPTQCVLDSNCSRGRTMCSDPGLEEQCYTGGSASWPLCRYDPADECNPATIDLGWCGSGNICAHQGNQGSCGTWVTQCHY